MKKRTQSKVKEPQEKPREKLRLSSKVKNALEAFIANWREFGPEGNLPHILHADIGKIKLVKEDQAIAKLKLRVQNGILEGTIALKEKAGKWKVEPLTWLRE